MSLVNVAYAPVLTWAHPDLDSLEEQALVPMLDDEPMELGLKGHEASFLETARGAPTLRSIALTAPYMHDGSIATLEAVIDHYAAGGRLDHAHKTPILRGFRLTDVEKSDLLEFLRSLTDEELLRDPRWSDPWPK
jgi:cytochrome c peroxidase